jgi:ankyrin repeat protein
MYRTTLILSLLSLGLTPIHIAAKFGHTELIDKFHKSNVNLRQLSRKTGLTALHIAAYYGNEGTYDFCLSLKITRFK